MKTLLNRWWTLPVGIIFLFFHSLFQEKNCSLCMWFLFDTFYDQTHIHWGQMQLKFMMLSLQLVTLSGYKISLSCAILDLYVKAAYKERDYGFCNLHCPPPLRHLIKECFCFVKQTIHYQQQNYSCTICTCLVWYDIS